MQRAPSRPGGKREAVQLPGIDPLLVPGHLVILLCPGHCWRVLQSILRPPPQGIATCFILPQYPLILHPDPCQIYSFHSTSTHGRKAKRIDRRRPVPHGYSKRQHFITMHFWNAEVGIQSVHIFLRGGCSLQGLKS